MNRNERGVASYEDVGADYLEGELSIDEQRDFFCDLSGCDPDVVRWCELFSAVRYVAIITRIMNRWVELGRLPKDQTVWRDNPPAAIAKDLLAEQGVVVA